MEAFAVGDRIRDIEDGDCYFEGVVTSVIDGKVDKYIVENVLWNAELCTTKEEDKVIGTEIRLMWWHLEKLK